MWVRRTLSVRAAVSFTRGGVGRLTDASLVEKWATGTFSARRPQGLPTRIHSELQGQQHHHLSQRLRAVLELRWVEVPGRVHQVVEVSGAEVRVVVVRPDSML